MALLLTAAYAALLALGPTITIYRRLTDPPDPRPRHHLTGPPPGTHPDPTRTRYAPDGDHLWLD